MAVWIYMPGYSGNHNPFHCDDCVPRGCTCNWRYVKDISNLEPLEFNIIDGPTDEDKPWKWVVQDADAEYGEIKEGKVWTRLDDDGREWPCAEYEWDKDGFDIDVYDADDEIDTHNEDEFER